MCDTNIRHRTQSELDDNRWDALYEKFMEEALAEAEAEYGPDHGWKPRGQDIAERVDREMNKERGERSLRRAFGDDD